MVFEVRTEDTMERYQVVKALLDRRDRCSERGSEKDVEAIDEVLVQLEQSNVRTLLEKHTFYECEYESVADAIRGELEEADVTVGVSSDV